MIRPITINSLGNNSSYYLYQDGYKKASPATGPQEVEMRMYLKKDFDSSSVKDYYYPSVKAVYDFVNNKVPDAPTTDGNYILKCSISSGTPTYSWVQEV